VGFRFNEAKLQGELLRWALGSDRLRLLMPQTFMNDSGRSIRAALDWFGCRAHQVLVLVDDMDLPLGRLRMRARAVLVGTTASKARSSISAPRNSPGCGSALAPRENPAEERKARTVSHVLGSFSRFRAALAQGCAG
jgi:PTH1 family peptidyl-tRNA hydrolase